MNDLALQQAIFAILPNATFGEDIDGQIVIYTNLQENLTSGELDEMEPEHYEKESDKESDDE